MAHTLPVAAIIALAFLAYANSLDAPFLLDNTHVLGEDPRIRAATFAHLARILREPYSAVSGLYRPLATLSYLFNYSILGNGANPAGYHWVNLLLHAINIALVYWLGWIIFMRRLLSFSLAAIWALHPIQTEAVTNIVGRADMLAAFGVLSALVCYREALRAAGRRKAAWLGALALAMAVGVFSKESAIAALAVMPLYDIASGAGPWRSRIPNYIALAAPCIIFLVVRAAVLAHAPAVPIPFVDNPLTGAGFWTARLTAAKVMGKYVLLFAWPAHLSYDYSYNQIPLFGWNLKTWEDWKAVIAAAAAIAALILAVRSYRNRKPLFFFIFFFFITFAPVSNFVLLIGTIMGERLLYLPSAALAACFTYAGYALAQRLPEHWPRAYLNAAALAAILIALAVRTSARNADWSNPEQFWYKGPETAPGSFKTHLLAASAAALPEKRDWPFAIAEADRAFAIIGGLPPLRNVGLAYRDLGAIYRARGDAADASAAVYWYRKALDALLEGERIELAKFQRDQAFNARRGVFGFVNTPSALYLELGRAYSRLHEPARAIAALEQGRVLDPNPELLQALADAYLAAGGRRKAVAALVEELALDPGRSALLPRITDLYAQIDPQGCAVSPAHALNMNCPLVHGDICAASRNIMAGYARTWENFAWNTIRRSAIEDLGCAPETLR